MSLTSYLAAPSRVWMTTATAARRDPNTMLLIGQEEKRLISKIGIGSANDRKIRPLESFPIA